MHVGSWVNTDSTGPDLEKDNAGFKLTALTCFKDVLVWLNSGTLAMALR